MTPAQRESLRRIDTVLYALVAERARLFGESGSAPRALCIEDILRRADGSLPAAAARALFEAVDAACAAAGQGAPGAGARP